jgi:uncharacterized membrane protein
MWEPPGQVVIERGHGWWPGVAGWLMPLLFLVVLIVFGIWAVRRITDMDRPLPATASPPAARPEAIDPAIHELRLRYARGEVDPEEFARRWRDLGGEGPGPPPPAPTETV